MADEGHNIVNANQVLHYITLRAYFCVTNRSLVPSLATRTSAIEGPGLDDLLSR